MADLLRQDVVLALKLAVQPNARWTLPRLAEAMGQSVSQVHASVRRCLDAKLLATLGSPSARLRIAEVMPVASNILEFAVHGVKYAFPLNRGGNSRGVPTAWASNPMRDIIVQPNAPRPVWPHREGTTRGESWAPLHPHAVDAALRDPRLYDALALVDVFRGGSARERAIAEPLLKELVEGTHV